jgi:hypothetical protein
MTRVLVMPHKQRVAVPEDLRGWMTLFDLPWASVFAYATAYCSYVSHATKRRASAGRTRFPHVRRVRSSRVGRTRRRPSGWRSSC